MAKHTGHFIVNRGIRAGNELIMPGAHAHALTRDGHEVWVVDPAHISGLNDGAVPIYDREIIPECVLEAVV